MEIDEVWRKIEALAGQQFTQMRGGKFTYSVGGGHVIPDRTNHRIPKSHFREALTRWPVPAQANFRTCVVLPISMRSSLTPA